MTHLDPERYGRGFSQIAQEIIARLGDAHVEITVEIRATNEKGFSADTVRTITENSTTLKLEQHGFE